MTEVANLATDTPRKGGVFWRSRGPDRKRVPHADEEPQLAAHHITEGRMRLCMGFRQAATPTVAAVKCGFSAATAYRIERDPRPPSQKKATRARRRHCLLASFWDREAVPLLKSIGTESPNLMRPVWVSR